MSAPGEEALEAARPCTRAPLSFLLAASMSTAGVDMPAIAYMNGGQLICINEIAGTTIHIWAYDVFEVYGGGEETLNERQICLSRSDSFVPMSYMKEA